jgi:hypothetical protein
MRKIMKNILYISILLIIQNASYALTSTKDGRENDALTCSGLFYVLTSISEPKELNKIFMGSSKLMTLIHGQLNFIRTGDSLTNGEIGREKSMASLRLGELYDKNPERVVNEYIQCNSWRADISKQLQKSKSTKELEKIIKNPPVSRKLKSINPSKDREKSHRYQLEVAMKAWSDSGRFTYMDLKDLLKK